MIAVGYSEPFVRLREQMWTSVFADAARAGTSIIFTFTPDSTVPLGFPRRVQAIVEDAGGRVCFVRLLVSEAEQERRREFHKLADVNTLRRTRTADVAAEQPPAQLEIDTDSSDAATAAAAVRDHSDLSPGPPVPRYPSG